MTIDVDIQIVTEFETIPEKNEFEGWVSAALQSDFDNLEQTIRIVDEAEIQSLNSQFRASNTPTNILSFPSEIPHIDYQNLGDLIICAPIVLSEAKQQGKDIIAHWAHLVVHGMLHLQGYDHEDDESAKKMEALEVKILSTLGYSNPYNI